MKNREYNDSFAFLFSLEKNKVYKNGKNKKIFCGKNHGPYFFDAGLALIWNEDGKFIGPEQSSHFSFSNNYFDVPQNELTGADKFSLEKMEVYLVEEISEH